MFPEVGKELKKPEDSHVASGVKVRTNCLKQQPGGGETNKYMEKPGQNAANYI